MNVKDDKFMEWLNAEFPESNMPVRQDAYANIRMIKRIWLAGFNSAVDHLNKTK